MTTSTNGAADVQITTEHLQELFRRLPAASEVMRTILLESENSALKQRLEALEATPEPAITSASNSEGGNERIRHG